MTTLLSHLNGGIYFSIIIQNVLTINMLKNSINSTFDSELHFAFSHSDCDFLIPLFLSAISLSSLQL